MNKQNTLPHGWKHVKLGEVAKIIGGFAFKNKDFKEVGFPIIKIKEIQPPYVRLSNSQKVDLQPYSLQRLERYRIEKGDYLIAMTGATIGKVGKVVESCRAYLNQRVARVQSIKEYADNKFIYYSIVKASFIKFIQNFSNGSNRANISTSVIGKYPITLPPLATQKAIAEVLTSLDDKIDLLHRQNKTLEQMAQTLFRQWFVEEKKEEWEEVNFFDFFDFLEGPGIRNWQYTEEGTRFINIRLIKNKEINIEKSNFVSNKEANGKYKHFLLKERDMIVSTSGTLGKTAIIQNYHLPLLLNTSVIRFRPKDGMSYSFMYQYLQTRKFQEDLKAYASGSVQKNFGPTHLRAMKFRFPPLNLLKIFSNQTNSLYEKTFTNKSQIRTLSQLRDTLLPKLMRGKITVKSKGLIAK